MVFGTLAILVLKSLEQIPISSFVHVYVISSKKKKKKV